MEDLATETKTSATVSRKGQLRPAIQPVSERFPAMEEQEIVLTILAPEAKAVEVAGNFNSWLPDMTPLTDMGGGNWVVRLMLRSGKYEYRFVVDGQWIEDPQASERVINSDGEFNSSITVPLEVMTDLL